jgi:exodeoxyribonuclease VII large subunit
MEQMLLAWQPERRIFTVSELTQAIRGLLELEFPDVWVAGEISGAKRAASGHLYFTLKDEDAQLQCACWKMAARLLRFQPQDGIAVLARGRIDVYAQRGQYQLVVETIEPRGYGALQLAFEQLKRTLESEGLFAAERKRPLPRFPRRIGLVTSPSGAAVRDMIQILTRRWPGIHIRIYPCLVQGPGSAEGVVEGIEHLGRSGWPEVMIVGRGGGSLEDLWTFNEEAVARAIAASPVPVVSAVGHETDFTIADFVADLRAPTPSAAAELVVPERRELIEKTELLRRKLAREARYRIVSSRNRLHERGADRAAGLLRRRLGRDMQRVDDLDYRLRDGIRARIERQRRRLLEAGLRLQQRDLRLRLAGAARRLGTCESSLAGGIQARLALARERVAPLTAALRQLSPLAVLERGYAIVVDREDRIVRDALETPEGTEIGVRLHRGRLQAVVTASRGDGGPGASPEERTQL